MADNQKPYVGQAGWRVVVRQDETAMVLDPSLPPPWWPNHDYSVGDMVVNDRRFYRCRKPINFGGADFNDPQNRYAWIDITGGYTDIREQGSLPDPTGATSSTIQPNHRLYVDTRQGQVQVFLPPKSQWNDGDLIEIVDDYRSFDKNPCILVPSDFIINSSQQADASKDAKPENYALNVVGNQDFWRFVYYDSPTIDDGSWLYVLSAPSPASGGDEPAEKKKPVLVVGPTDQVVSPNTTYIADTTNGPINFSLDEQAFEDGDIFTVMDFKWTFGQEGKSAILKTSPNVKYQDGDPTDGNFYMNTRGPTSSWPFMFYAGVVMCMNSPLDQTWINAVTAAINGETPAQEHAPVGALADPEQPQMDIFSAAQPVDLPQAPLPQASFPTFTTVVITSDVVAVPWTQYNVDMGRKKTLTVTLPNVGDVPPRSRVRVRLISAGRGVVSVLPGSTDQILGMFGNLNATAKGVPRTVHGQYNMIELESDGDHEWMVV